MKKSVGSLVLVAMVSSTAAFADQAWVSCRESGGHLQASVSPDHIQIGAFFEKDAFFEQMVEIGEPGAHSEVRADKRIHSLYPKFSLWYHGSQWEHADSSVTVEND